MFPARTLVPRLIPNVDGPPGPAFEPRLGVALRRPFDRSLGGADLGLAPRPTRVRGVLSPMPRPGRTDSRYASSILPAAW